MKYLLLIIFFITSCQNLKWAEKGIEKRDRKYPEVVATICMNRYNPIDSIKEITTYLPGKVIYKHDSIIINCDSLKKLNPNKPLIITTLCPPSILKVDTFIKQINITTSNKAEIYLLTKSKDSLKYAVTKVQEKLTKRNKQLRNISILFSILLLGIISIVYIKLIK